MPPDESLCLALTELAELDPPEISWQSVEEDRRRRVFETLADLDALVQTANSETVLCLACDRPHTVAIEYAGDGLYRAYCPDSGYQQVEANALQRLAVDESWIAASIASGLGLKPKQPTAQATSCLVPIGRTRFGPYACELFFARRLFEKARFEEVKTLVPSHTGTAPAIIVTSSPLDLIPGEPPPRCAFIPLQDVLRISSEKISVDEGPFTAALRGGDHRFSGGGIGFTFSPGFRSAVVGDQEYSFTDKQALAVEALYEARQNGVHRLHQTEVQGKADTAQRIGQLFRDHPAYGTLIKYDGSGYYWLDL